MASSVCSLRSMKIPALEHAPRPFLMRRARRQSAGTARRRAAMAARRKDRRKLAATTWMTRPARCSRPRTARKRAVITVRRFLANTFGQTMMLAMSVSSSSVMNTTPFEVPGRCRTRTRPATVTVESCFNASPRSAALRMAPSAIRRSRKNRTGCAFSDSPVAT